MSNNSNTTPAWLREELVHDNIPVTTSTTTSNVNVEQGNNNNNQPIGNNEPKTVAGITIPKSEYVLISIYLLYITAVHYIFLYILIYILIYYL